MTIATKPPVLLGQAARLTRLGTFALGSHKLGASGKDAALTTRNVLQSLATALDAIKNNADLTPTERRREAKVRLDEARANLVRAGSKVAAARADMDSAIERCNDYLRGLEGRITPLGVERARRTAADYSAMNAEERNVWVKQAMTDGRVDDLVAASLVDGGRLSLRAVLAMSPHGETMASTIEQRDGILALQAAYDAASAGIQELVEANEAGADVANVTQPAAADMIAISNEGPRAVGHDPAMHRGSWPNWFVGHA